MEIMMKSRLEVLDSLRGIAALGVVLHHFTINYGIKYGFGNTQLSAEWMDISIGRYGVELFFIISGFVISLTLEKGKNITEFTISRFSRLFPTYWFCLTFTSMVLYLARGSDAFDLDQFLFNLTMAPQFFWRVPVDGSYWTLMYELFFYFIIAIIFGKSGKITTKPLIFTFVIFTFISQYNLLYPIHIKLKYILLFPHLYLFWAGIIFYKIWKDKKDNIKFSKALYIFLFLLLFTQWVMCLFDVNRVNLYSSTLVTFYFLLFHLFINNKLEYLNNKYLVGLGTISYSLYLIHQEVGYVLIGFMYDIFNSMFISVFSSVLACIGLAIIINKYIETTSNRICKNWLLNLASSKENLKI
jgi:peptidoglycan/LPS O-acetylase OafA/YrhL